MFTRSELLMFRKVQKERDALAARLAEAKGLLEEIGDEWPAVKRTTVERAYALIARPADSASLAQKQKP